MEAFGVVAVATIDLDQLLLVGVLVAVAVSFCVSASAGLGGSLVLVPSLSLFLGVKEGVALAALLLASNNVVKVLAYRKTLPWRPAIFVIAATTGGAYIGARLLVAAPVRIVTAAVLSMFAVSLLAERLRLAQVRRAGTLTAALGAGMTSGFSGTSGPLKGVAIRNLGLQREHMVGAASLASLAGDAAKTSVFVEANLLGSDSFWLALAAAPLMLLATSAGRTINRRLGERGYSMLFWGVMGGYTVRLLVS